MKVTVIIPTFNSEKTIRECLESVLKQDFMDYEVCVIDDASTDKTRSLLNCFQDKRLKLIFKDQNRGQSICRKRFSFFIGKMSPIFSNAF